MSNFKLTNLTKTKFKIILSNLPSFTNVPIVSFMKTLEEIDNYYNKPFPLWIVTVKTVCFILVASPLIFLCIWQKCDKESNQCVTSLRKKSAKNCSVIEMVFIASGARPDLNARFQKALDEKGIDTRAYEKYMRKIYGNASINVLYWILPIIHLPFRGMRYSSLENINSNSMLNFMNNNIYTHHPCRKTQNIGTNA